MKIPGAAVGAGAGVGGGVSAGAGVGGSKPTRQRSRHRLIYKEIDWFIL